MTPCTMCYLKDPFTTALLAEDTIARKNRQHTEALPQETFHHNSTACPVREVECVDELSLPFDRLLRHRVTDSYFTNEKLSFLKID